MNLYLERYSLTCSLGLGSALGEKGKNIGVVEKKKKGGRSELIGSLGRKKGGGAWRHAFDDADPPSSNNLSLKFQHFSTSAYYVAFVKNI